MQSSEPLMATPFATALDLGGTFVFALSGALAGVRHGFDLFGVLVLSFAAATSGGIIRDLLIGAVPPPGVADWRYIVVPAVAGLATVRWGAIVDRMRSAVLILDAGGLALFAVAGTLKALDAQLGPATAMFLGVLTGIGGGIVRDILTAEAPAVLRGDIYAVAALTGSGVVVAGHALHLPAAPVALTGAALCFGLRLIAIRRGWQLPAARRHD